MTILEDFKDQAKHERETFERVKGHHLCENQIYIIDIINANAVMSM